MSNQSGRHAAVNAILGVSGGTYEGSFHAMFDADGIATGPFNSRLLAWLNEYLEATHTSLAGAQHAFAVSLGFASWNSLNTWDALSSYDPDAQAYIDATGELFPDDLNTLVLGIKAAGLWDDHIGSIKKAIGVPSLAASMIDLRNTAFNGTAVNTPTHSATAGWGFTKASSQYIDSGWKSTATNSKASLNSVHVGLRIMASTVDGGSNLSVVYSNPNALGFGYLFNGNARFNGNDSLPSPLDNAPPSVIPGGWIGTRTTAAARASYKNGALNTSDTQASGGTINANLFIGARNAGGGADLFSTSRITLWHAGAGLDATQAENLDDLFAAYALAAGEA